MPDSTLTKRDIILLKRGLDEIDFQTRTRGGSPGQKQRQMDETNEVRVKLQNMEREMR